MHLLNIHDVNDVRLDAYQRPEPGPKDVVVKMKACGICGSDLKRSEPIRRDRMAGARGRHMGVYRNKGACAASLIAMGWAMTAGSAFAQDAAPAADAADGIVVVGSQIKGAKINEALPVTVVSTDEIKSAAAVSGD